MQVVPVELESGRYDVSVERGGLARVGEVARAVAPAGVACVVADEIVADLYLPQLAAGLGSAGYRVVSATLPGGEKHKTLGTLGPIFETLLAAGVDRRTPVIGLGGGIATDMAGFVAGTLLRGVPLVQVPTSLLAMVDASVGGKTGVNAAAGKNLIGVFHQPAAVVCDPDTLTSLPEHQIAAGLAECVKHAVIRDATLFGDLEQNVARALAKDLDYLAGLVADNVAIKAAVVAEDPREHGVRAHLNLGHTFAHAIEKASKHAVAHGPAVGVGLCAAAALAEALGLLGADDARRVAALVRAAALPTTCRDAGAELETSAVVDAMRYDKKVRDGRVRFVLPDGLGAATLRDDVPPELVDRVTAAACGHVVHGPTA